MAEINSIPGHRCRSDLFSGFFCSLLIWIICKRPPLDWFYYIGALMIHWLLALLAAAASLRRAHVRF
jgi:hypothetical protein